MASHLTYKDALNEVGEIVAYLAAKPPAESVAEFIENKLMIAYHQGVVDASNEAVRILRAAKLTLS